MPSFELHPQLAADCHRLGRYELCHLLLHRNATLPWFILVPETDLPDLLDLPPRARRRAVDEAALVSDFVKGELGWPKINFAAIGNVVPQLHLHVIGRRPGDACWPGPVWGRLEGGPGYRPGEVASLTGRLVAGTSLAPAPSA
jgi:diadenosine tetraphosphate (Ap4A) HIT family hydrolase